MQQYKTWQEQDGELVPVCTMPEENKFSDCFGGLAAFGQAMFAYNESLKIFLPIIGDIESVRGRKDLKIDVDFSIQYQIFVDRLKATSHWKMCSKPDYETSAHDYRRIVAVLIEVPYNEEPQPHGKIQTPILDQKRPQYPSKENGYNRGLDRGQYNQMLSGENTVIERLKEKGLIEQDVPNTDAEKQDYVLQEPMNIYGMFFPAGTVYKQINNDWWYPVTNDGAVSPSYAVHFMVIKNNETYFKPKP